MAIKTNIPDLPNELLLHIFALCTIDTLLPVWFVSRTWRSLVEKAQLPPRRSRLFRFYLALVQSPVLACPPSVRRSIWYKQRVVYSEIRESYFRLTTNMHCSPKLPKDFEVWLHERPLLMIWPELAAVPPSDTPVVAPTPARKVIECEHDSWLDVSVHEARLACITLAGSGLIFNPGVVLYVTRILPFELSEYSHTHKSCAIQADASGVKDDDEPSVDLLVMCFGEGYGLVLDGWRGGEKLVGAVYNTRGACALSAENVLARSWTEFLEVEMREAERTMLAAKRGMVG